jgi:uncharacterized delta-60 repeat protein
MNARAPLESQLVSLTLNSVPGYALEKYRQVLMKDCREKLMKRINSYQVISTLLFLAVGIGAALPSRFTGVAAGSRNPAASNAAPRLALDDFGATALPDGSLDLGFDADGKVLTDLGGTFSDTDEIFAVALQSDGKIVSAGRAYSPAGSLVFALTRHNLDGSVDTSFGTAGRLKTDIPMGTNSDFKSALIVQFDGKILALPGADRELLRFNSDGTPDNSFGTGGKVVSGISKLVAMVLLPDGKIVATGGSIGSKFFVSRFNANGSVDSAFAVNGVATTNFSGSSRAIVLQTDGRIIVAGQGGSASDFALVRFNSDGTVDTSFGSSGLTTTDFGTNNVSSPEHIDDIALQPDGKIVAVGDRFGLANNVALARYNPNGTLDGSFGTGGKLLTFMGQASTDASTPFAVLLQSDQKILLAGRAFDARQKFAVSRLNADGTFDSTFGVGGKVLTEFYASASDQIAIGYAATLQPDGKLIVAGYAAVAPSYNHDFALARYITNMPVPPPNDNIQNAQILPGTTGTATGDSTGATRQTTNFFPTFGQAVEPLHDGKLGGHSLWYKWTAPATGTMRVWIDPGAFDSVLAVYNAGTVAPIPGLTTSELKFFTSLTSNDDFDLGQSNKLLSFVSFTAKKDSVYYLAVDGINGVGSFTLHWSQSSQSLNASAATAGISGLLDTSGKSLVAVQAGRTAPLTVVITGWGFTSASEVLVNGDICRPDASNSCLPGTGISTTFQNSNRLTAIIPPAYFSPTGDLILTVRTGNQLASNRGILHVSCIDVYQVPAGQTVNSNGPALQCVKPAARYSLLSTNDTAQPVTFTVSILDAIDGASRALASSPNVGVINSAIGLNLLIANGMRAGYGLPPLSLPLALTGGQILGNTAVNVSAEPKSILAGLVDLTYKPNVFLSGQDSTSFTGPDGTSIDRNRATIVAGGAGNIVATDGATIVATDGATIIAGGAGNIVATDGATIIAGGGGNSPTSDFGDLTSDQGTSATLSTGASSSPGQMILNDANSPVSRTGWYVFPDAQGGNTNLKGVVQPDGSLGLEANLKVNMTTLPRLTDINKTAFAIVLNPSFISFSQAAYTVAEGAGSVAVTVRRSNNLTEPAIVGYSTTSRAEPEFGAPAGTASDRSDYASASGSLLFAPGETEKTFSVFITDDGLGGADDGASETFNILLNNAYGAAVDGTGSARVTITDNDAASALTNAVDNAQFFVRQHYVDFLNREPDQSGLQFWTNQIVECEARPPAEQQNCREVRRVNVSAAFFLSIEFQETGFLVSRLHAASFGDFPASLSQRDFFLGTRFMGRDVVVGAAGWEAKLEANKQAFLSFWVTRPEFMASFAGKTHEDYVNTLFANAGVTTSEETTLRAQLITGLGNGTETRASALRKIAESPAVSARLFRPSFVLVQYMGYLRRQANETPDSNLDGYNFWLGKLNQFNGDYQAAEMVKAFIKSGEYRGRFGRN